MNILDIILLIPLLWAAFKGFRNGFINEIFSLLALFLGIYLTFRFSDFVSTLLPQVPYINIIAFIITFVLVVIGVNFVGRLFEKLITIAFPSILNQLLGLCFGVLKVLVICGFLLNFLFSIDSLHIIAESETVQNSKVYPYINQCTAYVIDLYKKIF